VSASADILAGELAEVRRALKRVWNALPVAGLSVGRTEYVAGCVDRAIDQTTEAVHMLEVSAGRPSAHRMGRGRGLPAPS